MATNGLRQADHRVTATSGSARPPVYSQTGVVLERARAPAGRQPGMRPGAKAAGSRHRRGSSPGNARSRREISPPIRPRHRGRRCWRFLRRWSVVCDDPLLQPLHLCLTGLPFQNSLARSPETSVVPVPSVRRLENTDGRSWDCSALRRWSPGTHGPPLAPAKSPINKGLRCRNRDSATDE